MRHLIPVLIGAVALFLILAGEPISRRRNRR